MKIQLFILLVFLFPNTFFSQDTNLSSSDLQPIDAHQYFGHDAYGALYYENENTFFKKKSSTIFQYTNYALGKINFADLANPLRILLFYKDFNSIVLLDSQCNEILRFSLNNEAPNTIASYAGMATLNKIWILDQNTNRLLLYDWNTKSIKILTPPIVPYIKTFVTTLNNAYWIDEQNNWFECDLFGKIILIDTLPTFKSVQIIDAHTLLYALEDKIYRYNAQNKQSVLLYQGLKSGAKFYYSNQILSIFTEGQININQIQF